jgi:hypothetical protein
VAAGSSRVPPSPRVSCHPRAVGSGALEPSTWTAVPRLGALVIASWPPRWVARLCMDCSPKLPTPCAGRREAAAVVTHLDRDHGIGRADVDCHGGRVRVLGCWRAPRGPSCRAVPPPRPPAAATAPVRGGQTRALARLIGETRCAHYGETCSRSPMRIRSRSSRIRATPSALATPQAAPGTPGLRRGREPGARAASPGLAGWPPAPRSHWPPRVLSRASEVEIRGKRS